MSGIPDAIRDVCRAHYGAYVGGGRWSPPNRCLVCPLREPCVKWGSAPAHTEEQLAEARSVFVAEADALIPGGAR